MGGKLKFEKHLAALAAAAEEATAAGFDGGPRLASAVERFRTSDAVLTGYNRRRSEEGHDPTGESYASLTSAWHRASGEVDRARWDLERASAGRWEGPQTAG
jgi:hypothetical protein